MSSDYKVVSRSEDYIEDVAAACRRARPQNHPFRFDPVEFIEKVLMVDGVESVWKTRWVRPKGKVSLKLFDRASIWDPPAEVTFDPIILHFDRTLWTNAKLGRIQEAFIAAHEIGHVMLHDATAKAFSNEEEARISFRKSMTNLPNGKRTLLRGMHSFRRISCKRLTTKRGSRFYVTRPTS
jgi:hypothetical protein